MTETTQKVLELLKTRNRVVLTFRKPKEENEMAKKKSAKKAAKKTTRKTASPKTAVSKADAVDVAVKAVKAEKKDTTPKSGKMSGLDAAAQVLAEAKRPMTCQEMTEQMLAKGLWQTGGKTPAATIYSAILREMNAKGKDARFHKAERGKFELAK